MTERRRFSQREKNALYRGADGKCAECGKKLPEGWHADHVIPYAVVGVTRVSGGQPLCPKCNLKKGSSMDWHDQFSPRHFQGELIKTVRARTIAEEAVTVGLIWPGSGKTLGYQAAATELMRLDLIDYMAVYAPRLVLAKQAELSWRSGDLGDHLLFDERCRLQHLRHRRNVSPLLPPGSMHEGLASTYQSLVSDPDLHIDWAKKHAGRFLLIGDEAQFLGAAVDDDDEKGPKAGQVFEEMAQYARHVLLLTGTADRADGRQLILCSEFYEQDDRGRLHLRPHVAASYSDGITSRYLREFDAAIHDCRVTWWANGNERIEYDLSASEELPREKRAKLAQILRQPEVWQRMCDTTVKRLRHVQQINREYRALIACMEQSDAKRVRAYLEQTYPTLRVGLAITQDGDAAERTLREFKVKPYDILVTVRKAFIGYDCPKITVVCALTNYRHIGHLTQLTFRAGRVWKKEESGIQPAQQLMHLIAPDDPAMRKFVEFLRSEQAQGIKLRGDDLDGEPPGPEISEGRIEEAHVTDVRGATYERDLTSEEYARHQAILDEMGPITTPDQLGMLFDKFGMSPPEPVPPPVQNGVADDPQTDGEITKQLKGDAAKEIGRYLRERGHVPDDEDYRPVRGRVTRQINDRFGIKSTDDLTTADEARAYLQHVRDLLASRNPR